MVSTDVALVIVGVPIVGVAFCDLWGLMGVASFWVVMGAVFARLVESVVQVFGALATVVVVAYVAVVVATELVVEAVAVAHTC